VIKSILKAYTQICNEKSLLYVTAGSYSLSKKLAEFCCRSSKIDIRHFLPRRKVNCPEGTREGTLGCVRGKKYFSACKRGNRSLLADDLCAAAGRNPFVKKACFFDSLKEPAVCYSRLLLCYPSSTINTGMVKKHPMVDRVAPVAAYLSSAP